MRRLGYLVIDHDGSLCDEGIHTLPEARACAAEQGYFARTRVIARVDEYETIAVPAFELGTLGK